MNKENFLQALKLAKPGLGNTNLIPGLDSYFFNGRTITSFNGSLEIVTTVNEDLPITGAIQGETLFKLVSSLDSEIELEVPAEDSLLVKSGRSKTTFPVKIIDTTFLSDVEEEGARTYLPISILFAAGLKRCMLSMGGKTDAQEVGIHVFLEGHACQMYSTNGHTFSRFAFPLENATETKQVFLPASFCEQLLFLYSEIGAQPIEIVVSEKYVRARFENATLRCSFYANPVNQDLKALIDDGIENISLVDITKDLSEAIKRSEIIAGNSVITMDYGDPETNKLQLTAKGQGKQLLFEEVELTYPASGLLHVDVKSVKKVIDTCKSIGFGDDYMVLVGNEDFFDHIISGRSH